VVGNEVVGADDGRGLVEVLSRGVEEGPILEVEGGEVLSLEEVAAACVHEVMEAAYHHEAAVASRVRHEMVKVAEGR
jgi:hypothetical protein